MWIPSSDALVAVFSSFVANSVARLPVGGSKAEKVRKKGVLASRRECV